MGGGEISSTKEAINAITVLNRNIDEGCDLTKENYLWNLDQACVNNQIDNGRNYNIHDTVSK